MFDEKEYGKSLKKKGSLNSDVYQNAKYVKVFYNVNGNPTYSLIYDGKKAIFVDDHSISKSEFKGGVTSVYKKKDL